MIKYNLTEESPSLASKADEMVNFDWKQKNGYTSRSMHVGVLGEYAYGRYTDQESNLNVYSGGDGGVDFKKKKVNVKTRVIRHPYIPDLILKEKELTRNVAQTYVFAMHLQETNEIILVGEITRDSFLDRCTRWEHGSGDEFMVSMNELDKRYDNVTHQEIKNYSNDTRRSS
tara:strand:+ start:256 stop:771 length:516 start_codon:yes stop_codon:yes gene_type:complete